RMLMCGGASSLPHRSSAKAGPREPSADEVWWGERPREPSADNSARPIQLLTPSPTKKISAFRHFPKDVPHPHVNRQSSIANSPEVFDRHKPRNPQRQQRPRKQIKILLDHRLDLRPKDVDQPAHDEKPRGTP